MANGFMMPRQIFSGEGALELAALQLAAMGKRAFVVTDPFMCRIGNTGRVTALLEAAGVECTVFDGVEGEPTDHMVAEGLLQYRSAKCDWLIAVGGGSPIDAMKAIAMLAVCGGAPADYMGKTVDAKLPPMAAVPTTAGTGSEATQFTIITDVASQVKMLLKGPSLLPDVAVVDPCFTVTAPPAVTAATGIDALCHALEAYTSRKAQPLSDTFALSAVKRVFSSLEQAYLDGADQAARAEMSLAALEAGIAFNNASVTIVHGMSRPLGALFHVPHGLSNAMLLDVCLRYIVDGAQARFAAVARYCGMAQEQDTDREAAARLIRQTEKLLQALQIPSPEAYGIEKAAFFAAIPKMAVDAAASGSPANTRKEITVPAMEALYRVLWQ